jgi:hypothetical protein
MTIDNPEGFCSPANNTSSFTATLNVVVFIDVTCTRTLDCSGNCNEIPVGCNNPENCNYTVPGGNFSFTFRFSRLGDGYICDNRGQFNQRWAVFDEQVGRKMTLNTLNEVDDLPDGSCQLTVPNGTDCRGNPKFKVINNPITRTYSRIKIPSLRVTKTMNSQSAVCNFT